MTRIKPPKKLRILSAFIILVRLALGCLFIWSSLPKIRQPYDFLAGIYDYEIVGPKLGLFVAMTLPWAELLVGICLVGGVFLGGALLVAAAMGAIFTFVIASALYRGLDITCGCFNSPDKISYLTLIRALAILLAALTASAALLLWPPSTSPARPQSTPS